MKTYSAKPSEITRKWYVIDASSASLGRVSTLIATMLTGKGKPMFSHHIDCGDYVVVINAADIKVTGKKSIDKKYYHHSQYPGGLRERNFTEVQERDPTKAITQAVRGMLPVNKLRPARLARLKVYAGSEHQHSAQQPEAVKVGEIK